MGCCANSPVPHLVYGQLKRNGRPFTGARSLIVRSSKSGHQQSSSAVRVAWYGGINFYFSTPLSLC